MNRKIALIGGGPAALFMYKKLIEYSSEEALEIIIYEKNNQLGAGFPYSSVGAMQEHITNVSGNEIPSLPQSMKEWGAIIIDDYSDYWISDYIKWRINSLGDNRLTVSNISPVNI